MNDELKRDIRQNQDTIDKLKASKADKKSQAVAVEKLSSAIKPLETELQKLKTIRKDLTGVSADFKKLERNLTDKLDAAAAQSEQIGRDYEQLEASLTELSNQTIDRDGLALEIFKLKKNFQNQLSEAVSDFNRKLDAFQNEVDGIDKNSRSQKQSMKKASQKPVAQPTGGPPQTGPVSGTLSKDVGTITEKDLVE